MQAEAVSLDLIGVLLLIIGFFTSRDLKEVPDQLISFWQTFSQFSFTISLVLLVGIVYSLIRISQIRREEKEKDTPIVVAEEDETTEGRVQWEEIEEKGRSENTNDRKVAIIEADRLLEHLLARMGYSGYTLGERLKTIERSDFESLDDVWEAHKIRNRIAHERDYEPTLRDVRKALEGYRRAFEEFEYI